MSLVVPECKVYEVFLVRPQTVRRTVVIGYLKEPVFGEQGIGFDGAIDGQF